MTLEEYKKKNQKKHKYLSGLLTRILILVIILFVLLIVVNFNPNLKNKVKNTLFETDYNFSYLNKVYNKYFVDVFNDTKKKSVVAVSKTNEEKTKEKYKDGIKIYLNNETDINLLNSGIVVFVGEKKDYGKVIIVQQSNGIDAWYGNIDISKVKLYDYIEKDKVIASANKYYYLVYEKDGKKINYDEANKKD